MSRIAAFCLGVMVVFALPARFDVVWLIISLILLSIFLWQTWRLKCLAWAISCLFLFGVGASYSYWRTQNALVKQWAEPAKSVLLNIRITGLPEKQSYATRFVAWASGEDGRQYRLQFQDYLKRDWQVGEHWQVKARVKAAIGSRNVVGFDREAWALANGIDGTASLGKERFRLPENSWAGVNGLRAKVVQDWDAAAAAYPQGAALMKALSVGDDSALSSETWAALRPLGLNHLISISGLHISMIGLMFAWFTKQIMRFIKKTPAQPRLWCLWVGVVAAAMYTALAGFEIPAWRSLLMLLVFAVAWTFRGAWTSWRIWWTAMAVVLLFQPMAVLSVGFALSFGLVAALLWVYAFRLPLREKRGFWQQNYHQIKQAAKGQWAATLVGGVASVQLFGGLPVWSPVVNAVAIPLFSFGVTPLALLASVVPSDTLKWWAAYAGEKIVNTLIFLGNKLPEHHFAHAPTALFVMAILASFVLLLPIGVAKKSLASVALWAFALYQPPPVSGSLKATVYDVGQGLAVLLQTPHHAVLYDTGTPNAGFALLPNLHAADIRQLDSVILSHHDNDHDGGFPEIQKHFPIKQLYAGQPEFYPHAQRCQAGQKWQYDDVLFEFVNLPTAEQISQKDNDLSCVLRVSHAKHALLITGDISQAIEEQLIHEMKNKLPADVLILAHHGSQSSNSSAFLRAVSPKAAVASSGYDNAYRHPSPKVQQRLAALQIQLLRTDLQGGLAFYLGEQGFQYAPLFTEKRWWQRKPF